MASKLLLSFSFRFFKTNGNNLTIQNKRLTLWFKSSCMKVVSQIDCFHVLGWDIQFFIIGLNGLRSFPFLILQKREPCEPDQSKQNLTLWAEYTDTQALSPIACLSQNICFSPLSQRDPKYLFLHSFRRRLTTWWTKTRVQHCESNPDNSKHFHTSLFLASLVWHRYSNFSKMSWSRFLQNRVSDLLNQNWDSKFWPESTHSEACSQMACL